MAQAAPTEQQLWFNEVEPTLPIVVLDDSPWRAPEVKLELAMEARQEDPHRVCARCRAAATVSLLSKGEVYRWLDLCDGCHTWARTKKETK